MYNIRQMSYLKETHYHHDINIIKKTREYTDHRISFTSVQNIKPVAPDKRRQRKTIQHT